MTTAIATTTTADVGMVPAQQELVRRREGVAALADMSSEEFCERLAGLMRQRDRINQIHRSLLVDGVDYGIVPGTQGKPTLLKPGAEKLCQFYALTADVTHRIEYGDGKTSPPIVVVATCRLRQSHDGGPVVAVGVGASTSWERKHRWRGGPRVCPHCSKTTIIKGRAEFGGGWLCHAKQGGCGAKWRDGAPEIEGQSLAVVENLDQFDLLNTLIKVASKRAFVDATLRGTATSGLYSQDLDDMELHHDQSTTGLGVDRSVTPPSEPQPDFSQQYLDFMVDIDTAETMERMESVRVSIKQAGMTGTAYDDVVKQWKLKAAQLRKSQAGGEKSPPSPQSGESSETVSTGSSIPLA